MRLYKQTAVTETRCTNGETFVEAETKWAGSQTEAASQRAAWVKRGIRRDEITTTEVDVPTDKKGLLAFLNALEHGG